MPQGPPRRRRARPVADAPIDDLLLRADELTKGWLLALLEQAPLDDAPAILAADLARDGPRVCAAALRALADDADLHRLEPDGALEPLAAQIGRIAGASGVEAAAHAVDTLGAVLWSAVRGELRDPDADMVSELAERLALVMELLRRAVLRRSDAAATRSDTGATRFDAGATRPVQPDRPPVRSAGPEPSDLRERAPGLHERSPGLHEGSPGLHERPPGLHEIGRRREEAPPAAAEALWMEALADEIASAERTGTPLSLMLVELEDAEHLAAAAAPGEAAAAFGRFAQAIRGVVRRQDILACETDARAWVIARETGRHGAHSLAARMVEAMRSSSLRGAPLALSVGFAVLGEDGREVDGLIGAAEEARFAASASGIGVVPMAEPPNGSGRPEGPRDPGLAPGPGGPSGLAG